MARRFVAELYSNCAECEDLIEPGDNAGYAGGYNGALCEECLEWAEDDEDAPR